MADMRYAPGGMGDGEECLPPLTEATPEAVPDHRRLRPKFLELILGHEPWASAARRPQVSIACALVPGDLRLINHRIDPALGFVEGRIAGDFRLSGTVFERSLSLSGSTVNGELAARRLKVGGSLHLNDVSTLGEIDLLDANVEGTVSLSNSSVDGGLAARRLKVGGSLHLDNVSTPGHLDLLDANVEGTVSLNTSTVGGKLNADRLEVGGSLLLRDDGTFRDIDLLGAKIRGNVDLDNSTVTGKLRASRLEVGGNLLLRARDEFKTAEYGEIELHGAKIGDTVSMDGATVTGKLVAQRMEVDGSLFLRDGEFREARFEEIDLVNARIGGNVSLAGSTVNGKLNANYLEVGGSLLLRDDGTFEEIDLLGAKVNGMIQFMRGNFGGQVDLTGAAIDGELHLSDGQPGQNPVWRGKASLILRNAKADALQARRDSWTVSGEEELLPTDLTGFSFNGFAGMGTSDRSGMGHASASWLIDWIKAQRDYGNSYNPEPYTQVATVLEAAGATEKARAIRFARFEHKVEHDDSISSVRRAVLIGEWMFVGYGVYPFQALYWFILLVVLGGLLAQRSEQRSLRGWTGLWYSLENALPLIDTTDRFKGVKHDRAWLTHFFHFQKAFGFVLATILVAALTLLGS